MRIEVYKTYTIDYRKYTMRYIRVYIPLILKSEAARRLEEMLKSLDDMGMWVCLYQRDRWLDVDYKRIRTDSKKFIWN